MLCVTAVVTSLTVVGVTALVSAQMSPTDARERKALMKEKGKAWKDIRTRPRPVTSGRGPDAGSWPRPDADRGAPRGFDPDKSAPSPRSAEETGVRRRRQEPRDVATAQGHGGDR
jgi:hypothetical protein